MSKLLMIAVLVSAMGCASKENKNTEKGAVVGAAAGAALGAIYTGVTGDQKKGALIGAAVGGAAGALIGKKMDQQAKELAEVAETKRAKDGAIITKLKGDITFATGKSDITQDARTRITKMGKIIKKYPENRLTIVGHTDSTGSSQVNEKLSAARAEAVRDLLVQNGVPAKHIKIVGAGAKEPIADNASADGRAQNRRVEINIKMVEEKAKKK